jgi:acyl-homoserine-lactone acylase
MGNWWEVSVHSKEGYEFFEAPSSVAITIMRLEEYVVKHFGNEEKPLPEEVLHECFFKAQTFLMKHYGTLEVPLGEIQKAKRFDVVLPMYGGVNTLANTHIRQYGKNKFEIHHGDSFIFYAKYGKDGLEELQTVNAFGNSTEKGNPFATNQTEMYVNMKTKQAILDTEELRKVGIVYHPK